jgi:uncharacterized protein YjbI with pentapeptide repeats
MGDNHGAMPNFEYPGEPVRSHRRRYRPAGLGPLDIRWQPRASRGGTYDRAWLERDFPGLPDDVDWRMFNCAPEDQQQAEAWQGGEAYRIEGMHPDQPVITGSLPRMRVRVFAGLEGTAGPAEHATRLDTVWFFPEELVGVAVYRTEFPVDDSDGLDVKTLMLAYEDAALPPRATGAYLDTWRLRTDPRTAALHSFNESQLTPETPAAVLAARQARDAAARAARQAELRAKSGAAMAQEGCPVPAQQRTSAENPLAAHLPGPEALKAGDFSLAGLVDAARIQAERAKAEAAAHRQELEQRCGTPPAKTAPQDAAGIAAQTMDVVGRLQAGADPLYKSIPKTKADLAALGRKARQAAPAPSAPSLPLHPDAAKELGQALLAMLQAGQPLAERDAAGADLAGCRLAGQDLHGIQLEAADLRRADLAGADLHDAVLTGAQLQEADLSGADLSCANLCGADLTGADLTGARLPDARAQGASFKQAVLRDIQAPGLLAQDCDLEGACLDGARLDRALLLQATAMGSHWRGMQAERLMLLGATLTGADFGGARLTRCVFDRADAEGSGWEGAQLTYAYLGNAKLAGSRWREASAENSGLRGSDLSGADLTRARFTRCDLGKSLLPKACLERASLSGSILMQADLRGAKARGVDLYTVLGRKADFRDADLGGANLVLANLTEARFGQEAAT